MSVILAMDPIFSHASSVALVRDGRVVASALEERFLRVKHYGGPPVHALQYCLREAGVRLEDVDHFALPYSDRRFASYARRRMVRSLARLPRDPLGAAKNLYVTLPNTFSSTHRHLWTLALLRTFDKANFRRPDVAGRLRPIAHHRAHAAAAYLQSGFEDAAVLTVDGQGENLATAIHRGEGSRLHAVEEFPIRDSLGYFYAAVTEFLGWEINEGEGKTMGLAPYGGPNPAVATERLIRTDRPLWSVNPRLTDVLNDRPAEVERALGIPRRAGGSALDAPYPDVAWAAQHALERALVKAARRAMEKTGADRLALSGGTVLNCKANMAVVRESKPREMYVQAAAGDGGTAVGAALALAAELGEARPHRVDHDYWGPAFEPEAIERLLLDRRIRYEKAGDVAKAVAERVARGEIVGWFQGRMELGPRSLGNRAVLADSRTVESRDRLNLLKGREAWRPLCPSLLAERAGDFLEDATHAPFMILSFHVREAARKEIPAAVHVDGTTRPQTVTREANPLFHDFLSAFADESGVPVVLNTSFNLAGYPIAATPLHALADFYAMGLDALALGPFIVSR